MKKGFLKNIRGAAAVEYMVLLGLIGVLTVGTVLRLGISIDGTFATVETALASNMASATSGTGTSGPSGGGSGGAPGPVVSHSFQVDANPYSFTPIAGSAAADTLTVTYGDISNVAAGDMGDADFQAGTGGENNVIMSGFTHTFGWPMEGNAEVVRNGEFSYDIIVYNTDGMPTVFISVSGSLNTVVFDDGIVDAAAMIY